MGPQQIEHFFKTLDSKVNKEVRIILTGAAAGHIMGSERPSIDIDFAIKLKEPLELEWEEVESAIRETIAETGIQVNFAEDIDKWGMITLLDYEDNVKFYKKYGSLAIWVLNPAYWSIGKVTRFIDPDIQDMIQVFIKTKISPIELVKVWGRALRESPRSMVRMRFCRQVESFLKSFGRKIWGRSFNSTEVIRQFNKSAGIET